MRNDMIARYVYAVTRKIPSGMREDVSQELNTLITDMLEERCKGVLPSNKDIRVVLTELGTTSELAAQYNNNNGKNCLIGEPYYSAYKTVLKIVLLSVGAGMGIVSMISLLTGEAVTWYMGVLDFIGMILMGLVYGFTAVTILFAVFYHKDITLGISENLNELPEVPKKQTGVSKGEAITGIVCSVIFMLLFLIVPPFIGVYVTESKEFIPIFNVETMRSIWYVFVAFGIMGIAGEILKLVDGRISKRVAIATVIMNVISLPLGSYWLLQDKLINPAFHEWTKAENVLSMAVTYLPRLALVIVVLLLIGDTVVTLYHYNFGKKDKTPIDGHNDLYKK